MLPRRRGRPTLESYDVLFELARGGMGVVYVGRTKEPEPRLVAIKLMSEAAIEQRKHVDMFLDEMWIASCVRDEHVVEVLDAGEHEGQPFLVMEFVVGLSLLEILKGQPPSGPVLQAILAATARGLHAAHETLAPDGEPLHVVHRDVSPHNVLVGFDGRVKVTDFGVAAARGRRTQTTSGEIKGKVSYMAPEQITREHATDRRADLWALGVIGWEAFAGRKLFTGSDDAQRMFSVLRQPIPDLRELAPEVPPGIADAIMGALTRDVVTRTPTASAFADAMDAGSASKEAVAAWMRAHHGARERTLAGTLREAEGREVTVASSVLVRHAAGKESERPPVIAPSSFDPRDDERTRAEPRRASRAARLAPWVALVGLAAAALVIVPRLGANEDRAFGEPTPPGAIAAPPAVVARSDEATVDEAPPVLAADSNTDSTDTTDTDSTDTDSTDSTDTGSTETPEDPTLERADSAPPTKAAGGRRSRRPRHEAAEAPATVAPSAAEPAEPAEGSGRRAGGRLLDNPFAGH